MTIFSFVSIFSAALALIMGVVVLLRNRNEWTHRIFFLMSMMIAAAAFFEFGFRQAESAASAAFWLKMSEGTPLIIGMICYFTGIFTKRISPGVRSPAIAALFLPALFFFFCDVFTNAISGNPVITHWGWGQSVVHSTLFHAYAIWSTIVLLLAAGMSVHAYVTAHTRRMRVQSKYVALAVSLIVVVTIVVDLGMNYLHVQFPEFATLAYACANLLIAYAIRRHELFVFSPVAASDAILATMSDALFLIAPRGEIIHVNKAATILFATSAEEILGKRIESFIRTDQPILKQDDVHTYTVTTMHRDMTATAVLPETGVMIPISITATTMNDMDGQIAGTVVTMRDIRERVNAERALREYHDQLEDRVRQRTDELNAVNAILAQEREQLAITFRSIGDGVITSDINGRVLSINKMGELLTGWSEEQAIGQPVTDILKIINKHDRSGQLDPAGEAIRLGVRCELSSSVILTMHNGDERIIDDSAAPITALDGSVRGAVVVFRDVTEKERLEEELFRAKRMESVAVLAGGIAHDFSNLLTGINNNLFMCKMAFPDNVMAVGIINETEREILRAQQLSMQLLTFAQGGEPIMEICSPKTLVEESIGFFMSGSNCTYELDFKEDLMNVLMDKGMMEQVFSNLIINAEQAMPGGGTVFVSASNVMIDENSFDREIRMAIPLKAGIYIRYRISDEGTGIPSTIRDKVFDPFFSTKGKGRGLGLSTAQSIVRKHGGIIIIDPEVGKGTTFYVFLPATEMSAPEQVTSPANGHNLSLETGGEMILLMDDEDTIRQTTTKILELMGYRVVSVRNGEEAVAQYRQSVESGVPFDVLILDLTIPGGMGGKECIKKCAAIDPGVTAIVSSGYSNDAVMANYQEYGFKGVLRKPYSAKKLGELIREILTQKSEWLS